MNIDIDSNKVWVVALVGAFVVWRIYRRVQRLTTRQQMRPFRSWFAVIFFPLLVIGLLFGIASTPLQSLSKLAGVAVGVGLAFYGLRHTRFEVTADGLFYKPNTYIGAGIALLLVGRIAWRFAQMYAAGGSSGKFSEGFIQSPLTLFVVGILAGYYAWYAFGLLRWRSAVNAESKLVSL